MKFKLIAKLLLAAMAVLTATQAMSETRVTYKSVNIKMKCEQYLIAHV